MVYVFIYVDYTKKLENILASLTSRYIPRNIILLFTQACSCQANQEIFYEYFMLNSWVTNKQHKQAKIELHRNIYKVHFFMLVFQVTSNIFRFVKLLQFVIQSSCHITFQLQLPLPRLFRYDRK